MWWIKALTWLVAYTGCQVLWVKLHHNAEVYALPCNAQVASHVGAPCHTSQEEQNLFDERFIAVFWGASTQGFDNLSPGSWWPRVILEELDCLDCNLHTCRQTIIRVLTDTLLLSYVKATKALQQSSNLEQRSKYRAQIERSQLNTIVWSQNHRKYLTLHHKPPHIFRLSGVSPRLYPC